MIVFLLAVAAVYGSVGVVGAVAWLLAALRDRRVETLAEHSDRAIANAQPAEELLFREIYAAQSFAREGVDIYAHAPKEAP